MQTTFTLTSENHIVMTLEADDTHANAGMVRGCQRLLDDMYEPTSDAVQRVVDDCRAFLVER